MNTLTEEKPLDPKIFDGISTPTPPPVYTPTINKTWWESIEVPTTAQSTSAGVKDSQETSDEHQASSDAKVDGDTPIDEPTDEHEPEPDEDDGDLPKTSGVQNTTTTSGDPTADLKSAKGALSTIHNMIPGTIAFVRGVLLQKEKESGNKSSAEDVESILKRQQVSEKRKAEEYYNFNAKIKDYHSKLSGGDRFADFLKINAPFFYTNVATNDAKRNSASMDPNNTKAVMEESYKLANDQHHKVQILKIVTDVLVDGGNTNPVMMSSLLSSEAGDQLKVYEEFVTKFQGFKATDLKKVEMPKPKPEKDAEPKPDEESEKTDSSLSESIRGDVRKMWVVRRPVSGENVASDLLSHDSFDNMYNMYSEGITSDDIYGIYFDRTKALNVAKRLVTKFSKRVIEPSEDAIMEARKRRKKKKKKTTARKRKTKKKTRPKPKRRKSTFGNALAMYSHTPEMSSGPDGGGGDGGGGGGGE
jgi:hypothetical protein